MNLTTLPTMKEFNRMLSPYQKANWKSVTWQLINSVLPYLGLIALMFLSLRVSYWLTLLLAIPTAGFMVRTFILFHDCGHNSFTPSVAANKRIGFWLGVLTFTPSEQWWKAHAIHHATSGNLDKRGVGDVDTWTVQEYRSKPWLARLGYSLFRFPLVMFILGPLWMFLIAHRLPIPPFGKRETMNVIWADLALAAWLGGMSLLAGGFLNVVKVMLPVVWLAGMAGIWLFYVQHQFEGVYWAHEKDWNYVLSALKGASYYRLPRILQWFSGNIGFHHIHHLSPRIPNYRLQQAYDDNPVLQTEVTTLSTLGALKTVNLRLVDEARDNRLVSFRDAAG
ncbi:MAG TPA: fatty acid desaturase [Anaerolineaceae bacterium]